MPGELLNAKQSHVLRWLLLIPLSVIAASWVVTALLTIVLPDDLRQRLPENALFLIVIAVAGVGCGVVEWVGRRGRRGGAPSGGSSGG
ncbi:hypothetical protein SAMN05421773_12144 [Streptomyces aidingensis]|uniref:Uncharacterized protein n=1 Tax=Streptomyces aidingensis TaxID=910347 RepID=A0A1I1TUT8_9ACTN|nr:hypothetical protein SAMN05421773_12144 [Streptomyces aidingensis]